MKPPHLLWIVFLTIFLACKKDSKEEPAPEFEPFELVAVQVDSIADTVLTYSQVGRQPSMKLIFSSPLDVSSAADKVLFNGSSGEAVQFSLSYENDNRSIVVKPASPLASFSSFRLVISQALQASTGQTLKENVNIKLTTGLDSTDKFARIPDDELLTLVQRQTFKYFWDFAHPVSGLARERNTSGETVTSGGSGFGIMSIVIGVHRNFITRQDALARTHRIVDFLKNKAQRFHGAFPHWMNGTTGAVQPFSTKDNGADLVETSLLFQGLLTARQFFNGTGAAETALRDDITILWNDVEWDWFRRGNGDVLYWHWSPEYGWDLNLPVQGWNEALITYVLAASSPRHAISKSVYDRGWANNGQIVNGNKYYDVVLPLGPANGGPLFFSHYSFLGLNPNGLKDAYADYGVQNKAHALINYRYSVANPKKFYGYSEECWGLTASDDINGYLAHAPGNDNGVLSPTAALSSFPYTPEESMRALKFFYYKLGDRLWKEYGFIDAFSLFEPWFAESFLAIDQGPVIVMIENYRSGLLWELFMSCPEVKKGLKALGFTSPHI
ncbi:glucoamylase family protein [Arcticibacter sp.]|uniref:glucoamylase family protein n=1 Tax=Arcticibacter sp. TaxID=1872630 RepID=UPI00388D5E26